MTDLNNKAKRQEMIQRYLNADTSIEEERLLLDYYTHAKNELPPEEEDAKLIITTINKRRINVELSDKKEKEFDKMMKEHKEIGTIKTRKKASILSWPTLFAAAVILAFVLTTKKTEENPIAQQYVKKTSMKPPYSNETKKEGINMQQEKEATFQAYTEKAETASHNPTTLEDGNEEAMASNSIKIAEEMVEQERPATESNETHQTEMQSEIGVWSTVNEPENHQYPLNVTTANYSRGKGSIPNFMTSGEVSFETMIFIDGNTTKQIAMSSDNGLITLYKEMHDDSVVYKIDGERVSKETVIQLPSENIEEVRMLKRGSADAIMEGPYGRTNDIILIKTKKAKANGKNHSSVPLINNQMISDFHMNNGICLL